MHDPQVLDTVVVVVVVDVVAEMELDRSLSIASLPVSLLLLLMIAELNVVMSTILRLGKKTLDSSHKRTQKTTDDVTQVKLSRILLLISDDDEFID